MEKMRQNRHEKKRNAYCENKLSSIQQEVYQKLLNIDKKAAEAYRGALRVLKDLENPDRYAQFAHSVREVTSLVSRKESIPQEIKEDEEYSGEEKRSLKKKLEKQFVEQPDLLPPSLGEKVEMLMRKWVGLHNDFTNVSHHGRDASEKELTVRLSEFEAIILQFLRDVPVTIEELDSLLSIKNPTEKHINKLTELLKHPTHVKYFFSILNYPGWIQPLKEQGFFSNTPAIIRDGDYVKFPVWPLSGYLMKVAEQKPRKVMDIIKDSKEKENFRVWGDFIQCSLKMPSSIAKEIIPLAKGWIKTPYFSYLPEEIGELCIKLSNEQEVEPSLDLLGALLDVKIQQKEKKSTLRAAQPHFEIWSYKQILDKVVPVILKKEPYRTLGILCDNLFKAIKLEFPDKDSSHDRSHLWRLGVGDQQRDARDAKNILVSAIKDSMEALGEEDIVIFEKGYRLLSKYDSAIFRRIEFHLMRTFPRLMKGEVQKALSQRKFFDDIITWHEYYHLLREHFSSLPRELKEKIIEWIDEGPDSGKYEARFKKETGQFPSKKQKDDRKAHWQIRHLSAIKDALSPEWRERWDELMDKYEEPHHPDYHFYMEAGFAGARAPLEREDIRKMTAQKLIDYFKGWKPSKDFSSPSREGLGGLFRELLDERLSDFIKICDQFKTLHPAYTYYLIDGLWNAVRKEKAFDWNPVITLCKDIVTASELPEVPDDEDKVYDWKNVKRTISDLLKDGLASEKNSPPFDLRKTIFKIIETQLQDAEPDIVHEEKYGGENLESFTLSLNTVRGKAMHALFQYALWCSRCLNLTDSKVKMVPEVREKLERMLDPKYEPTQTIRAVFGEKLPLLFHLNTSWAEKNLSKIFPEDAKSRSLWRAAWEAYITYVRFYIGVYQAMRPIYERAIKKLDSPMISKEAKEGLTDHMMVAFLWEKENLNNDSLVKAFFQQATPDIRGHAIWFIGRQLEQLPEQEMKKQERERFSRRAMDLLEWRLEEAEKADSKTKVKFQEELKSFGTWFLGGNLDATWAISQLVKILELTEGRVDHEFSVIDALRNYVDEYYMDVLSALNLFVKGDREGWMLMSSKTKMEECLDSIIGNHPPQKIKDNVNKLVNNLTKKGYHEFAKFFIK